MNTTAQTVSAARRHLALVSQALESLEEPAHPRVTSRDELYCSALLVLCTAIGLITEARTEEMSNDLEASCGRHRRPRVYLCAAFSRQREMLTHQALCRALGVSVQARWLYAAPDNPDDPSAMGESARECLEDIASVDALLAFSEPRQSGYWTGGRHVEIGYALALRKRVVVIGPVENVFHAHPSVTRVDSLLDALAALGVDVAAVEAAS